MINLINNLSATGLLVLMVSIFIICSLLTLFLAQKYCTWLRLSDQGIFGEIFANTMPTIFGFILAFVTISVWQNYNTVNDRVLQEAHRLYNLYRTINAYPPEVKDAGKSQLKNYATEVIKTEWPLLTQGQFDVKAFKEFNAVESLIVNFKPNTLGELSAQQEMLRQLSEYRELRRARIENAKSFIDPPLWAALFLSAELLILFSVLFKTHNIRMHALMTTIVGASLGIVFFLLVLYNNPFLGPNAIQPAAFKNLLESFTILDAS